MLYATVGEVVSDATLAAQFVADRLDKDARFILGGEIDLSETGIPWVTTTRAMLRYTKGEYLEGYSFGLAASF